MLPHPASVVGTVLGSAEALPGPPDPSQCTACGGGSATQNSRCCQVPPGTAGATTSESTCCGPDCTYSFQCGPGGAPTLVKGAPAHSWPTADAALCWSCQGGTCTAVAQGAAGTYPNSTCGNQCVKYYTCASDGSGKVVESPSNAPTPYTDPAAVPCFKCGANGACTAVASGTGDFVGPTGCTCYACGPDTDGFCKAVPAGQKGTAASAAACTGCQPSKFSCGDGGAKVPDPQGVTAPNCWSCVGGACTAVPNGQTGQFPDGSSCACYACTPNGCCDAVPDGTVGDHASAGCDAACQPKFYVCDPSTRSVQRSCAGGSLTVPNCWACGASGVCEFKTDGTGTFPNSQCGQGCWSCVGGVCTAVAQGGAGQFRDGSSCTCFACTPNGCCDAVPDGTVGDHATSGCDAVCQPKFYVCDASTQSVQRSCTGGSLTQPNCFGCSATGECEFKSDGTGVFPDNTCGGTGTGTGTDHNSGCWGWSCAPNAVTPQRTLKANVAPNSVQPCTLDPNGQCCPKDGYVCAGASCCPTGTCVDRAGQSAPGCCPSGQSCDTASGKCVKKKTFPGWAVAVIVVVVLAAIAAGVGSWIHKHLKKAKAQPHEATVVTEDGVTTFRA